MNVFPVQNKILPCQLGNATARDAVPLLSEGSARNVSQLDKRSELTDNMGDEGISTFSVREEESREVPPASGGAVRAQRAPGGEGSAGNVVRTQRCQDEEGNAATIAHANHNSTDNDNGNGNDINDDDDNGESIAVASVAGGETASHNAQQEDVDGNLRGEGVATVSPPVPETLVPMPVLDAGAGVANERYGGAVSPVTLLGLRKCDQHDRDRVALSTSGLCVFFLPY